MLVSDRRRPAVCRSFDVFQMHAITDMLLPTDIITQIDSNDMYNLSVVDIDDAILHSVYSAAETADVNVVMTYHHTNDEHFSVREANVHCSRS